MSRFTRRPASFAFPVCLALAATAACGKVDAPPGGDGDAGCDAVGGGGGGVVATKIRVTRLDKVDLLFVVDNSSSMADKQLQLARSIPSIVQALTVPSIDPATGRSRNTTVSDLHVGVVTTSLGSHGTSACAVSATNAHNDDHGHLLPRAGEGGGTGFILDEGATTPRSTACPAPVAASALRWVFDPTKDPGALSGSAGARSMELAASCVVQSVRDDGCGYEETWEAMYHFLVDPQPYLTAEVKCTFGASGDACGTNKIVVSGVDDEILKERKAFLRPDSLLSVVVLSDENDVSLKPAQLNWLPWGYGAGKMMRGWKACDTVPDDFEPETAAEYNDLHTKYGCFSCFENTADPGGNCSVPWSTDKLNADPDGRALRGFHQIQRFGYSFLWSRQRYVDAFKNGTVPGVDASGAIVGMPNPLFAGGFRTPDLVLVTGIVGVPMQLVADASGRPKALTADDWDKMISPDQSKRDPHMVESIAPRTAFGIPKFAGDRTIDPVNGGDRDILDGDDLQYACIGKRSTEEATAECSGSGAAARNPICGAGTQPYYKAYPGLRHLRILHDLGASGLAASICDDSFSSAIIGLGDKLQASLNSQCMKAVLVPDPTGRVDCQIVESFAGDGFAGKTSCETIGGGYCTPGAAPCRVAGSSFAPTDPRTAASQLSLAISVTGPDGSSTQERVTAQEQGGNVYATGSDGVKHLVCEELQLAPPSTDAATANGCLHDPTFSLPPGKGGWCYSIDAAVVGDTCIKTGSPGTLRYLGDVQPKNGSEVFTTCVGASEPPTCK